MDSFNNIPEIKENQVCTIPGCSNLASEQWFPAFCSLREADIEIKWAAMCTVHDIELNEYVVRFFFGAKYDKELAEYVKKSLEAVP